MNAAVSGTALPALEFIARRRQGDAGAGRLLGVAADMAILCAIYGDHLLDRLSRNHGLKILPGLDPAETDESSAGSGVAALRPEVGWTLEAAGRRELADLLDRQEVLWREVGRADWRLPCVECALVLRSADDLGRRAIEVSGPRLNAEPTAVTAAYAEAAELSAALLGASPTIGGPETPVTYGELPGWFEERGLGGEQWMGACGLVLGGDFAPPLVRLTPWARVVSGARELLARKRELDHPDGPESEGSKTRRLWWSGDFVELPPIPHRLSLFLWRWLKDDGAGVPVRDVRGVVWPEEDGEQSLKQALFKLNQCLKELKVPWVYTQKDNRIFKRMTSASPAATGARSSGA